MLTSSGYGVHSRQVFKWLIGHSDFNVTTECVNWGTTSWIINPEFEGGLVEEIMKRSSEKKEEKSDISFQIQLPDEWDTSIAKFNVGITAAVETDKCNPDWIKHVNKMDLVIVPSSHVKRTLINSGDVTTTIEVVPESYHESITSSNLADLNLSLETKFNFLILGQFTSGNQLDDRKNILNTIKWICEVFKNDSDVGIILKSNHGKNTQIDRKLTRSYITEALNSMRESSFPKVHILHGHMTEKELASLYRDETVKCLVSLTRGEGYGLPILEAAASDLPIIATNWSGHLDFLSHGKFIPVTFKLEQISKSRVDNRIFIEGTRWAEPLENNFKKKIKKFRHNYETPAVWAQDLGKKVREIYSQDSICKIYDDILNKHLDM